MNVEACLILIIGQAPTSNFIKEIGINFKYVLTMYTTI